MKLLTLNISYYGTQHGPWDERRELIATALREAAPDIVALQAVARDPEVHDGLDQASQLARDVPEFTDVLFQTVTRHDDGREEGMAFLSRHAILDSRAHLLSHLEGTEDPFKRLLLQARFDTPAGDLTVFSAHFSWVAEQALDNVRESIPHLGWVEGAAALVGDFNQTPDSQALALLREAGWSDAWAQRPAGEGHTYYEGGAYARRIDYVLLNAALQSALRGARVVAATAEGPLRASDHAGVLVELAGAGE